MLPFHLAAQKSFHKAATETCQLTDNFLDDHAFPGPADLRMAQQRVGVRDSQQIVQQAAVAQVALGMLDDPLDGVFLIGWNPSPEERAVGDFKIVADGRRRDSQSPGDIRVVDDRAG